MTLPWTAPGGASSLPPSPVAPPGDSPAVALRPPVRLVPPVLLPAVLLPPIAARPPVGSVTPPVELPPLSARPPAPSRPPVVSRPPLEDWSFGPSSSSSIPITLVQAPRPSASSDHPTQPERRIRNSPEPSRPTG